MSKRVSSREFFHNFVRLHAAMKPGETVVITRHGKPLGEFRKQPVKRSFAIPDFKNLGLEPKASIKARDALYKKLMGSIESEGIS
jgi:antitoxin (DNA-binding transcriptional repressor) of toxin-antitoxin stability system